MKPDFWDRPILSGSNESGCCGNRTKQLSHFFSDTKSSHPRCQLLLFVPFEVLGKYRSVETDLVLAAVTKLVGDLELNLTHRCNKSQTSVVCCNVLGPMPIYDAMAKLKPAQKDWTVMSEASNPHGVAASGLKANVLAGSIYVLCTPAIAYVLNSNFY